jgi:hypothetical protein
MVKFGSITLEGGTILVAGPMDVDEGRCMQRVDFLLVQGATIVEGKGAAVVGEGTWTGEAAGFDLQPGPVMAVGVALFFDPDDPPISVETRTWCQAAEITAEVTAG